MNVPMKKIRQEDFDIWFGKCSILHTHRKSGALQSQFTTIKDGKYYLLEGSIRIAGTYENQKFKKGWYDKELNFISEITKDEQNYMEIFAAPF